MKSKMPLFDPDHLFSLLWSWAHDLIFLKCSFIHMKMKGIIIYPLEFFQVSNKIELEIPLAISGV